MVPDAKKGAEHDFSECDTIPAPAGPAAVTIPAPPFDFAQEEADLADSRRRVTIPAPPPESMVPPLESTPPPTVSTPPMTMPPGSIKEAG